MLKLKVLHSSIYQRSKIWRQKAGIQNAHTTTINYRLLDAETEKSAEIITPAFLSVHMSSERLRYMSRSPGKREQNTRTRTGDRATHIGNAYGGVIERGERGACCTSLLWWSFSSQYWEAKINQHEKSSAGDLIHPSLCTWSKTTYSDGCMYFFSLSRIFSAAFCTIRHGVLSFSLIVLPWLFYRETGATLSKLADGRFLTLL